MATRITPPESSARTALWCPTDFDAVAAYTGLRISLGVAMFMHGLARFIGGIEHFAQPTIAGFARVALPHDAVVFVVYAIPYLEVVIGFPIVLGLFTRWALLANVALLLVFIFGSSMQQNWGGVGNQLIYTLITSLLLLAVALNRVSLDGLIRRESQPET
ncbi:MAG TPA: DoxX family protein [bacterium]|nr:DoxX family protein [bacterium]